MRNSVPTCAKWANKFSLVQITNDSFHTNTHQLLTRENPFELSTSLASIENIGYVSELLFRSGLNRNKSLKYLSRSTEHRSVCANASSMKNSWNIITLPCIRLILFNYMELCVIKFGKYTLVVSLYMYWQAFFVLFT